MDRADRVIAFIETLKAPDGRDVGKPIVLRPWQKDILHQVYGPVGPDGRRISRETKRQRSILGDAYSDTVWMDDHGRGERRRRAL